MDLPATLASEANPASLALQDRWASRAVPVKWDLKDCRALPALEANLDSAVNAENPDLLDRLELQASLALRDTKANRVLMVNL